MDRVSVPAGLAGMLNEGPPVAPRPSASVLLVRGRRPWEVLLMRRPRDVDFAPGAHVFPGGSVHPEDQRFADATRGAAIRELFEEVGVLLARTPTGVAKPKDVERLRRELAAGHAWPDALNRLGLRPALEGLTLFAHWITPEAIRRRFDTSFYLARMPAGQEIEPSPTEVADWTWIEPQRALAQRSIVLVYATHHILKAAAQEPDAARLIARFRRRKRVPSVQPRLVQGEKGWTIVH